MEKYDKKILERIYENGYKRGIDIDYQKLLDKDAKTDTQLIQSINRLQANGYCIYPVERGMGNVRITEKGIGFLNDQAKIKIGFIKRNIINFKQQWRNKTDFLLWTIFILIIGSLIPTIVSIIKDYLKQLF